MYKVEFHQLVWIKDFNELASPVKVRILKECKEKLSINLNRFKWLRKKLKHYRRLCIGDYRVIYWVDEG